MTSRLSFSVGDPDGPRHRAFGVTSKRRLWGWLGEGSHADSVCLVWGLVTFKRGLWGWLGEGFYAEPVRLVWGLVTFKRGLWGWLGDGFYAESVRAVWGLVIFNDRRSSFINHLRDREEGCEPSFRASDQSEPGRP